MPTRIAPSLALPSLWEPGERSRKSTHHQSAQRSPGSVLPPYLRRVAEANGPPSDRVGNADPDSALCPKPPKKKDNLPKAANLVLPTLHRPPPSFAALLIALFLAAPHPHVHAKPAIHSALHAERRITKVTFGTQTTESFYYAEGRIIEANNQGLSTTPRNRFSGLR